MQETKIKAERISLAVVTAGLVITACGRLASRADREGTNAALSAIDFVVEIVMVVVFAALVFRGVNRPARTAPSRGTWMWISVGVIGALASIALLTLRIEGAFAQSPARLRNAQAAAQSAGEPTRMNELVTAWNNEIAKMSTTPVHQIFTGEVSPGKTFTREEVREHRETVRSVADLTDALINACRQAEARKLDPAALDADVSRLLVVFQRVMRAMIEKSILIDQHWEEWQSGGVHAETGSSAPRQKELLRLEDEMKTAQKDLAAAKEKLREGRVRE